LTLFNEYASGYEWDYQSFGLAASGALTIIVNLQVNPKHILCYNTQVIHMDNSHLINLTLD